MAGKRTLTPEEKKLWKLVTKHDRKLKNEEEEESTPAPQKAAEMTVPMSKESSAALLKAHLQQKDSYQKPQPKTQGSYANIDRNTAERFRKGNMEIDATLDLHGMTSVKAQAALMRFIEAQYKKQSRCLLVITGKGKTGEGVLKSALPGWLAQDELSPKILAFDKAQAKHGGGGAYYVLLRRKRS